MLILQILLVPIFALTLLSAIFLVGVDSVTAPSNDSHDDYPIIQTD